LVLTPICPIRAGLVASHFEKEGKGRQWRFIFPVPFFAWDSAILIFLSRIMDVSLGTVRVIFVSRGMKYVAPIIGFFEVLIWILVIGQIAELSNPICYIAYGRIRMVTSRAPSRKLSSAWCDSHYPEGNRRSAECQAVR
jgi:hypothetical protein